MSKQIDIENSTNILGISYYFTQDYNKTIEILDEALKINENEYLYLYIGKSYKELKNTEKAKESFNNSLKINNNFYEARKEVENLN
nr:tetratricopeptide repeat protein [Brachyspira hyodysenteriae]